MFRVRSTLLELCGWVAINQSLFDRDLEYASQGVDCVVVSGREYSSENRLAHSAQAFSVTAFGATVPSPGQIFRSRR